MNTHNLKIIKQRDAWETELRVSKFQLGVLKNNWNVYELTMTDKLRRYKEWLESRKMEPLVDFKDYEV